MKKAVMMLLSAAMALVGFSSQASRMAACETQTCSPQYSQAAKKVTPFVKHYEGLTIKRDTLGIVTVDGKPAAQDEVTPRATSYSQGLYTIIIYKTGKVAVMKDRVFQGYAR